MSDLENGSEFDLLIAGMQIPESNKKPEAQPKPSQVSTEQTGSEFDSLLEGMKLPQEPSTAPVSRSKSGKPQIPVPGDERLPENLGFIGGTDISGITESVNQAKDWAQGKFHALGNLIKGTEDVQPTSSDEEAAKAQQAYMETGQADNLSYDPEVLMRFPAHLPLTEQQHNAVFKHKQKQDAEKPWTQTARNIVGGTVEGLGSSLTSIGAGFAKLPLAAINFDQNDTAESGKKYLGQWTAPLASAALGVEEAGRFGLDAGTFLRNKAKELIHPEEKWGDYLASAKVKQARAFAEHLDSNPITRVYSNVASSLAEGIAYVNSPSVDERARAIASATGRDINEAMEIAIRQKHQDAKQAAKDIFPESARLIAEIANDFNSPSIEDRAKAISDATGKSIEESRDIATRQHEQDIQQTSKGVEDAIKYPFAAADPDIVNALGVTKAGTNVFLAQEALAGKLLGGVKGLKTAYQAGRYTEEELKAMQAAESAKAIKDRATAAETPGVAEELAGKTASGISAGVQKTLDFLDKNPAAAGAIIGGGVAMGRHAADAGTVLVGAATGAFGGKKISEGIKSFPKTVQLLKAAANTPQIVEDVLRARRVASGGVIGTFETAATAAESAASTRWLLNAINPKAMDWMAQNAADLASAGIKTVPLSIALGVLDNKDAEELGAFIGQNAGFVIAHEAAGNLFSVSPERAAAHKRRQQASAEKWHNDLTKADKTHVDGLCNWDTYTKSREQHLESIRAQLDAAVNEHNNLVNSGASPEEIKAAEDKANGLLAAVQVGEYRLKDAQTASPEQRQAYADGVKLQLADLHNAINGHTGSKNVKIRFMDDAQLLAETLRNNADKGLTPAEVEELEQHSAYWSGSAAALFGQDGVNLELSTGKTVQMLDPRADHIIVNTGRMLERMKAGEAAVHAAAHEVGHALFLTKEFRNANSALYNELFGHEITQVGVGTGDEGIFKKDDLVKMFNKYAENMGGAEAFAQRSRLVNQDGSMNEQAIAQYMREEMMSELIAGAAGNGIRLSRDAEPWMKPMMDWFTAKTAGAQIDSAIRRAMGATGVNPFQSELLDQGFTADQVAAARDALRTVAELQGNLTRLAAGEYPEITPDQWKNLSVAETFAKDLHETDQVLEIRDKDGNVTGVTTVTDPTVQNGKYVHVTDPDGNVGVVNTGTASIPSDAEVASAKQAHEEAKKTAADTETRFKQLEEAARKAAEDVKAEPQTPEYEAAQKAIKEAEAQIEAIKDAKKAPTSEVAAAREEIAKQSESVKAASDALNEASKANTEAVNAAKAAQERLDALKEKREGQAARENAAQIEAEANQKAEEAKLLAQKHDDDIRKLQAQVAQAQRKLSDVSAKLSKAETAKKNAEKAVETKTKILAEKNRILDALKSKFSEDPSEGLFPSDVELRQINAAADKASEASRELKKAKDQAAEKSKNVDSLVPEMEKAESAHEEKKAQLTKTQADKQDALDQAKKNLEEAKAAKGESAFLEIEAKSKAAQQNAEATKKALEQATAEKERTDNELKVAQELEREARKKAIDDANAARDVAEAARKQAVDDARAQQKEASDKARELRDQAEKEKAKLDRELKKAQQAAEIAEKIRTSKEQAKAGNLPENVRNIAGDVPEGGSIEVKTKLRLDADGKPILKNTKALNKERKAAGKIIYKTLIDAMTGHPDEMYTTGVAGQLRGTFSPAQVRAIQDLPESVMAYDMKQRLLLANRTILENNGGLLQFVFGQVADKDGKPQPFNPKQGCMYPISIHFTKDGNFNLLMVSETGIRDKLNLWSKEHNTPGGERHLELWNGNTEAFMNDLEKLLQNWRPTEEAPEGYVGERGLHPDPARAVAMKNKLNDFLNYGGKDNPNPVKTKLKPKENMTEYEKEDAKSSDPNTLVRTYGVRNLHGLKKVAGRKLFFGDQALRKASINRMENINYGQQLFGTPESISRIMQGLNAAKVKTDYAED
jgi:hypothetical protein